MKEEQQLATEVVNVSSLESAKPAQEEFQKWATELVSLETRVAAHTVTGPLDKVGMDTARQYRLALRAVRIEVEKKRKELGDSALRRIQSVNGAAKLIIDRIGELEGQMKYLEDTYERHAKELIAATLAKRQAELAAEGFSTPVADLGSMREDDYQSILGDARTLRAARDATQQALREAEAKRVLAEAEQREKDKAEAERIKAELAARQEELRVKDEANRVEQARLTAERDAAIKAQRYAAEAAAAEQRRASEAARAEQLRLQAEANRLRDEAEAARKAESDRLYVEQLKQREAELEANRLATGPDRDKLNRYIEEIRDIAIPQTARSAEVKQARISFIRSIETIITQLRDHPVKTQPALLL